MASNAESKWLSTCIESVSKNKLGVGSTRADLLKLFSPSAGISARLAGAFLFTKYPYVKVEVQFKPASGDMKADPLNYSLDDIITVISKPTSGPMVID